MSEYKKKFKQYLDKTGGRYTAQKEEILDIIIRKKSHFEVEEFLLSLLKKKIKISRATFYRTIKQLQDANLIQRVAIESGKVFYEKNSNQQRHDHVICNQCGRILEMHDSKIDEFLKSMCDTLDFSPEYRSLHIYGKCKNCA